MMKMITNIDETKERITEIREEDGIEFRTSYIRIKPVACLGDDYEPRHNPNSEYAEGKYKYVRTFPRHNYKTGDYEHITTTTYFEIKKSNPKTGFATIYYPAQHGCPSMTERKKFLPKNGIPPNWYYLGQNPMWKAQEVSDEEWEEQVGVLGEEIKK